MNVTLTLEVWDNVSAVSEIEMMIANNPRFSGASWEPFAASKDWILTAGDGEKAVYAKFRDAAENISSSVSDTINLYETTPLILFSPDPAYVSAGNRVKVDVRVENVTNLVSAHVSFSFDPEKVEVTDINLDIPESLLASTGATAIVSDRNIDNDAGFITFGAIAQQSGFTGVSGDGPIATVTFQAKVADPTSDIVLDEVELYDYPVDVSSGPISGIVSIEGHILPPR